MTRYLHTMYRITDPEKSRSFYGRTYDLAPATGTSRPRSTISTLRELAGQGIEPEREPYRVREGGSRICFVRDPDG
jgi:hypothetical protein